MTAVAAAESRDWLARITLSEPDPQGRVIVLTAEGPALRLPAPLARVLQAAQTDPARDPAEIASGLGLTAQQVQVVLDKVAAAPSVAAMRRRPALVQFRPPFTVQFTLFDPSRLFRHDGILARVIRARATWLVLVGINMIAAVTAAVLMVQPTGPLSERLTIPAYFWLLAGFLLSMLVHESAHALTLIAYGGSTHRLGFMFFYLAPAFFCDVRDSWSIPPKARVKVALAGVMAQGVISAICGTAAFFAPPDIAGPLALLALLNILYWCFNLIPLVKFDGYVALAGYLDRPHLRDHSIAAFRDAAAAALYGRPRSAVRMSPGWMLFGAASALFPLVLVVGLVMSLDAAFSSLGVVAVWIELAAASALLVWASTRVIRHVAVTWRSGVSRVRLTAVWLVAAAALIAAMTLIPIPQQQTGGIFLSGQDAQVGVLSPVGTTGITGTSVTARGTGILPGPVIGTARVADEFHPCSLPLEAMVAVRAPGLTLPGWCAGLSDAASLRTDLEARSTTSTTAVLSRPSRTVVERFGDLWAAAFS